MYTTLIEPEALAEHTGDPDWVTLDCRFDLARPEWGAGAYTEAHIPGALYAHLDRDLSGPVTPTSGRHPLPASEALLATLGRWGIDDRVQVISYDQNNGAYASRLWWLLRWAGHIRVAVLNGGFTAWQRAALPVSEQPGVRQARCFITSRTETGTAQTGHVTTSPAQAGRSQTGHAQAAVVSTAELSAILAAGQLAAGERTLIDARGADRFAGQNETIDPVAGHIPGALNHPFAHNLDAQGHFLPPQTLRSRWLETLRGNAPTDAIAMCGSGITACHNLLALEVAGLGGAQLYAGSWSEWIRDAARPIEQ